MESCPKQPFYRLCFLQYHKLGEIFLSCKIFVLFTLKNVKLNPQNIFYVCDVLWKIFVHCPFLRNFLMQTFYTWKFSDVKYSRARVYYLATCSLEKKPVLQSSSPLHTQHEENAHYMYLATSTFEQVFWCEFNYQLSKLTKNGCSHSENLTWQSVTCYTCP